MISMTKTMWSCAIGETLIHEIGHYFGLSEEEIEQIEERYWRGLDDWRRPEAVDATPRGAEEDIDDGPPSPPEAIRPALPRAGWARSSLRPSGGRATCFSKSDRNWRADATPRRDGRAGPRTRHRPGPGRHARRTRLPPNVTVLSGDAL